MPAKDDKQSKRIVRDFSPAEREEWQQTVASIEAELPEIVERNRLMLEAIKEPSVSGQLRRAIYESKTDYAQLASLADIDILEISEFMCGRATLDSDAFSRLADFCKLQLTTIP